MKLQNFNINLPESLYKGLELDLYMNGEKEGRFELVEKMDNWREQLPYEFIEINPAIVVNAIKEKWRVRYKGNDPFVDGREVIRFIARYHSQGHLTIEDVKTFSGREELQDEILDNNNVF